MSGRVDQCEIVARNPQVDPQRVEQTREMIRRLRGLGVGGARRGFGLAPPAVGRPGVVRADRPADDSRLFQPVPPAGGE